MYKTCCILSIFIAFSINSNAQNIAPGLKWQKTFGSATSYEMLYDPGKISLIDRDGGYLIATTTLRGFAGYGENDLWVAKLDTQRNVKWSSLLGGSSYDVFGSLQWAHDSGYIVSGYTKSNNGNVSGNHGGQDAWVVRLNSQGNIIWQKCYGGTSDESGVYIERTTDGYMLLGTASSSNGDVSGVHSGSTDIWVVKIDKNGNIQWQKCLGGSGTEYASAIKQTTDGGFIVTGTTASNDGDVQGLHGTGVDIWVVKLDNIGNIEWQKCLGGSDDESSEDIEIMPNGGYIVVGATYSRDGDVTGYHPPPDDAPYAMYDAWVVSLSNSGELLWQKAYGGDGNEFFTDIQVLPDHTFLAVGAASSSNGDVSFSSGNWDCWLVKFNNTGQIIWEKTFQPGGPNQDQDGVCSAINSNGNIIIGGFSFSNPSIVWLCEAGSSNTIEGYAFRDTNGDGIKNSNESFFDDVTIKATKNGQVRSAIPHNGYYKIDVDTGSYAIQAIPNIPYYTPIPATTNVSFTNFFNAAAANFSIQPQGVILPNTGSTIMVDALVGAPPTVNFGDTLRSLAWIEQSSIDATPVDDTITLKQLVTGSFDPNDKTEANAGIITPAQVSNGEYLNYLIRFQNTGTDTAFNITVRDTLENRLDWNTLQMITSSHTYQLSIEDGNKLTWQFNNIKLPYSGVDEPNSHGYIAYRIKPKPTVQAGDTIKNTAGIYFDYNLPVATNTDNTIVFMVSAPLPVNLLSFQAAPDGSAVNVTWKTSMEENLKQFEVQHSANGVDFTTIGIVHPGQTTYLFKDKQPLQGYNYYRLRSVDIDGRNKFSTIVLVNFKNEADIISSLYPNPGNGNVMLKLHGTIQNKISIRIIDQQGIPLFLKTFDPQQTNTLTVPLNLEQLTAGYYVLQIVIGKKKFVHKLVIQ